MSMGSDPGTSDDSGWAIQLEEGSGGVEVLDRWTSLAPIKDVVVVNDDSGAMVSPRYTIRLSGRPVLERC